MMFTIEVAGAVHQHLFRRRLYSGTEATGMV